MNKIQKKGLAGENEVFKLVECPNCSKKLVLLPKNYPLFDIQCTGCSFRAQIKSVNSKPKDVLRGAGWDIISKVIKSGFLTPPLFVNFKWTENGLKKHQIRFYPFIPKENIKKYQLSDTAKQANYKMFNYIKMHKLPYFLSYSNN